MSAKNGKNIHINAKYVNIEDFFHYPEMESLVGTGTITIRDYPDRWEQYLHMLAKIRQVNGEDHFNVVVVVRSGSSEEYINRYFSLIEGVINTLDRESPFDVRLKSGNDGMYEADVTLGKGKKDLLFTIGRDIVGTQRLMFPFRL